MNRDSEQLRDEYEELEDRITEDKWALADWLLDKVPNPGKGKSGSTHISLEDVASWRGRSQNWLRIQRQMAEQFPLNKRDSRYSVSAHHEAWKKTKSVSRSLALLEKKGGSTRALRGSKGDGIATIKARPTEEQAKIVAELLTNPKVQQTVIEKNPEALTETVAQSMADTTVSDAVHHRISQSPTLSGKVAHNVLTQSERKGQYNPPPRSREEIDAKQGELNSGPPSPQTPWTPFWQAMRLLDEVFNRMHPGAWDSVPGFNAQIALAAGEKAELLSGLAEAAKEKVADEASNTTL